MVQKPEQYLFIFKCMEEDSLEDDISFEVDEKNYISEFKKLKNKGCQELISCDKGSIKKDRYIDTRACRSSKVVLDSEECINANWLTKVNGCKVIATQGPIEDTVKDFWKMVVQYKVSHIIMVANYEEKKGNKMVEKCYEYLSKDVPTNITIKPVGEPENQNNITKIQQITDIYITDSETTVGGKRITRKRNRRNPTNRRTRRTKRIQRRRNSNRTRRIHRHKVSRRSKKQKKRFN